jgi:hypothetical protein
MVDWNDYALKPQMQSVQQAPAPAPAPAPTMPFGLGGLFSALLGKTDASKVPARAIDVRDPAMQSLVSMFNTPNPANTPAPAPAPAAPHKPSLFDLFGGYRQ